jgi:predicted lipid-binding transport protein (Tim44 family)
MPNTPFFDILIFAVVAGVILFRLYTVLGRRTGNERPPRMPENAPRTLPPTNVTTLPDRKPASLSAVPSDPVARGLMDIQLADRGFETEHFLSGAKAAYEMIVTAFAAGDRVTLRPLLSDEVYAAFDGVIRGREERGEKIAFTFIGFKDAKIVEAEIKDRTAEITLAFSAQFTSVTTRGRR